MKILSLVMATFLFFLTQAFSAGSYRARHCEIFIPKVTKERGNFGAQMLVFHIKIRNDRLDDAVEEVGFRYKGTVRSKRGNLVYDQWNVEKTWRNVIKLPVSHEDAELAYEGSFYVKTKSDTYYWLNSADGKDFKLDKQTYLRLEPSQFNPDRCN